MRARADRRRGAPRGAIVMTGGRRAAGDPEGRPGHTDRGGPGPRCGAEGVMDRESDFTDLMARAGSGDPEAIRDFLERFEQEVRVMVRARLPRKLRPRFDSGDFVQEVWQACSPARAIGRAARVRECRAPLRVPPGRGAEQGAGAASPADPHGQAQPGARGAAVHRPGRSRDPAGGRLPGPVPQRERAGRRPARAVDGRVRPARDRGPHAPPAGPDLRRGRRADRDASSARCAGSSSCSAPAWRAAA